MGAPKPEQYGTNLLDPGLIGGRGLKKFDKLAQIRSALRAPFPALHRARGAEHSRGAHDNFAS